MDRPLLGLDIGGTKCAACVGWQQADGLRISAREAIPTDLTVSPEEMLSRLYALADRLLTGQRPLAVGISCGGPLDDAAGRVLGPPNLPGWDDVAVTASAQSHFGAPAALRNDADAGALAEWHWGAGKGCRNMIFLTFGTGMGAGLILNGRLYSGSCGMGGEVGHIRLSEDGPVGYGKPGSFEGFCSGGGIARMAAQFAAEDTAAGHTTVLSPGADAKEIAEAARAGDATARRVFDTCAQRLGQGLAMLVDLLNPQRIVIGSLFARCHDLLWEKASAVLANEALPAAAAACQVVPAALGERIGDYAALAAALEAIV